MLSSVHTNTPLTLILYLCFINSGLSGRALRPRESPQCAQNEEEPPPCAEVNLGYGRRGLAGLLTASSI